MISQILVHILFGCAVAVSAGYFYALKKENDELNKAPRFLFYGVGILVSIITVMLMINVLSHKFEYSYVYGYSNTEMQTHFLVASFYSGQEGSFLLWTLWVTFIGFALLPYVKRRGYEKEVMGFYSLILVFLTLMLVVKNPFSYVWETYAKDGVAEGFIPQNGKGLNPLLHNIWITIHPPILFVGFASMSVPFVFALAGLVKRDYQRWMDVAFPWALFASAVLGFGIMLGGFWAYETLGWGGFWAWDPVENSSLIPWLFCVALVHTMLVQKKTKGLVKTNIVLAVLSFLSVIYSTFLTRSGILGDTSVHSFVDPGYFAYILLLSFMIGFTALSLGLMAWRYKDILNIKTSFDFTSREFGLSIGASLVLASAFIVTIGTSYPAFAEVLGQPKVAMDVSFYNVSHIYIMIAILLVNAVSIAMSWRKTSIKNIVRKSTPAFVTSLVVTSVMFFVGVREWQYVLLLFCSVVSLVINGELAVKLFRSAPQNLGAYISHVGIALLVLGVVATAGYTETTHARLVANKPTNVLGHTLEYLGKEQIELEFKDRDKYKYFIKAQKGPKEYMITPIVYYSDFNKKQSPFLEPGIWWGLRSDVYISPKGFDTEGGIKPIEAILNSQEFLPFTNDSLVSIKLVRFDMSEAQQSEIEGTIKMATIVELQSKASIQETKLYTYFNPQKQSFTPQYVDVPNTTYKVGLVQVERNQEDPSKSKAVYQILDSSKPNNTPKEVFIADVSIKPWISFVWFGVITMVAGFFISIVRYYYSELSSHSVSPQE